MSYFYRAFGLTIASEVQLDGLHPVESRTPHIFRKNMLSGAARELVMGKCIALESMMTKPTQLNPESELDELAAQIVHGVMTGDQQQ